MEVEGLHHVHLNQPSKEQYAWQPLRANLQSVGGSDRCDVIDNFSNFDTHIADTFSLVCWHKKMNEHDGQYITSVGNRLLYKYIDSKYFEIKVPLIHLFKITYA